MINEKYINTLKRLYNTNRFRQRKVDLTMISKASKLFNNPQNDVKYIHVTGTNGKGSVCKKLSSILTHSGYKTGLFISPHISTFRERIQIDDKYIDHDYITNELDTIYNICDSNGLDLTYFELVTLLSLLYFKDNKVDYAVMEVGLGGNLDATNIIDPLLSIITSIGIDHTDSLGFTQREIAINKAGIIKPNRPALIGADCFPKDVFINRAKTTNSKLYSVEKITKGKSNFFDYDVENKQITKEAIKVLEKEYSIKVKHGSIEYGLSQNQPCRKEDVYLTLGKENVSKQINSTHNTNIDFNNIKAIYLDVGHNQHGLEKMLLSIREKHPYENLRIVCGFSANKDKHDILKTLCSFSDKIYLVAANHHRAMVYDELIEYINEFIYQFNHDNNLIDKNDCKGSVSKTIVKALSDCKKDDVVLICGSFFLMNEARITLGYIEESDPFELNEVKSIVFNVR